MWTEPRSLAHRLHVPELIIGATVVSIGTTLPEVLVSATGAIVGAACIAVGADLLVDNGTIIAQQLGVPESVIALTFVALGTSLPELVTAITALVKGHSALSLGNIVGANLFNLVLVSGISTVIRPFSIYAMEARRSAASRYRWWWISRDALCDGFYDAAGPEAGKLTRAQGILLLCIYAAFCVFQFVY